MLGVNACSFWQIVFPVENNIGTQHSMLNCNSFLPSHFLIFRIKWKLGSTDFSALLIHLLIQQDITIIDLSCTFTEAESCFWILYPTGMVEGAWMLEVWCQVMNSIMRKQLNKPTQGKLSGSITTYQKIRNREKDKRLENAKHRDNRYECKREGSKRK